MSEMSTVQHTYKRLNSSLLVENNILQIDPVPLNAKVSSLCIPTLLSYKKTVKIIFIINPSSLYISVL